MWWHAVASHVSCVGHLQRMVHGPSVNELIRRKYLVPPVVYGRDRVRGAHAVCFTLIPPSSVPLPLDAREWWHRR